MSENPGPRLVERAINILLTLSDGPKSLTAICHSVDLSKATVHRILAGLSYSDFVVQNLATGEYMLGSGSYRMARSLNENYGGIVTLARPAIDELRNYTEETIIIHVRVGDRRLCIEEIESPHSLRYTSGAGTSAPLHTGSAGKILMAWMEESDLRKVLSTKLERLTEATIVDWDILLQELGTVRAQGWAESYGERISGASAISAPILDDRREVIAALSVLGPATRLTHTRLIELRGPLLSTSHRASELLGARPLILDDSARA